MKKLLFAAAASPFVFLLFHNSNLLSCLPKLKIKPEVDYYKSSFEIWVAQLFSVLQFSYYFSSLVQVIFCVLLVVLVFSKWMYVFSPPISNNDLFELHILSLSFFKGKIKLQSCTTNTLVIIFFFFFYPKPMFFLSYHANSLGEDGMLIQVIGV